MNPLSLKAAGFFVRNSLLVISLVLVYNLKWGIDDMRNWLFRIVCIFIILINIAFAFWLILYPFEYLGLQYTSVLALVAIVSLIIAIDRLVLSYKPSKFCFRRCVVYAAIAACLAANNFYVFMKYLPKYTADYACSALQANPRYSLSDIWVNGYYSDGSDPFVKNNKCELGCGSIEYKAGSFMCNVYAVEFNHINGEFSFTKFSQSPYFYRELFSCTDFDNFISTCDADGVIYKDNIAIINVNYGSFMHLISRHSSNGNGFTWGYATRDNKEYNEAEKSFQKRLLPAIKKDDMTAFLTDIHRIKMESQLKASLQDITKKWINESGNSSLKDSNLVIEIMLGGADIATYKNGSVTLK